jgi:signal transduction histidine kinase
MKRNRARSTIGDEPTARRADGFRDLAQGILQQVNREISRTDFLEELAKMLLDFSACDAVELRVGRGDQCLRCEAVRRGTQPVVLEVTRRRTEDQSVLLACQRPGSGIDAICRMLVEKQLPASSGCLTQAGSFWTGDLKRTLPVLLGREFDEKPGGKKGGVAGLGPYSSLAVLPLAAAEETIGLLQLRSKEKDRFQEAEIESVAQAAGLALQSQLAHASLRERIKELTCLYSLAQLAERPGIRLEQVLQGVVELLPAAWQYPEIAAARVVLDGHAFATTDFEASVDKQSVGLVAKGRPRGSLEVGYTRKKPELDEGPFLEEERRLIDTVARQVAGLIERREAAEDQDRLEEQLRHADRLATIGQLSAGVAHELNEPLGNILAFAQLASKEAGLPAQAARDLDKIVATSLHAREIIKKLMLFARQTPPQKKPVGLNAVVEEALYFLESRCLKQGVSVERRLAPELPEIAADPSQLNQVLVNLAVNALQAMPAGGTLTIATGVGMDAEVQSRIFTPFFTTKDVNEGTGLGLPVVHGIVTSHEGTIAVRSEPGRGARFEISLPVPHAEND